MNGYYKITDKIKELLLQDPDVNTVTKASAEEIDSYKFTMFPLVHLSIEPSTFNSQTATFVFTISALSQREKRKEPTLDKFINNDNEDDNLNAMFYVLVRLYLQLLKFGEEFTITNDPQVIPKIYQFKNLLDGWEVTFEIEMPLDIDDTGLGGC